MSLIKKYAKHYPNTPDYEEIAGQPTGRYSSEPENEELGDSDPEDFIQHHILGFCCCGDPGDFLRSLKIVLEAINRNGNDRFDKVPTGGISWLVWYWLDKEGITEHGSAVSSGWLTQKGKSLLEDLDEIFKT